MSIYTILAAPIAATTEEKNSEFLTFLHPVTSRDEAMVHVDGYRKQYPDAAHVCWAYVIGNTRQPQTQAFSDDGEPSGTAGKPMLHVLTERELGNSLAVVVRYFGGVKLGAGGLVRAYSGAVSAAVNCAQLVEVTPCIHIHITVDFAKETKIRHLVNTYQGQVLHVDYAMQVTLQISLAAAQAELFTQQVINETAGDALVHIDD
ncbi:YigZ family protein [Cellvibrio fibrivorans]|uniref:YigZ family protein n=1 Tax=Cellvibrio fibrivorans TaxID=126350 RepID=A0ABU1V2E3_9GAMM|nr:YigZ family protein [Cellvibrio fibrivorans]MDR7091585.1 putative YigZ family protein [Cellvibrio fibrivorans]